MTHYELLFVIKPTHTQEEIEAHVANVKASIEKDSGSIAATQDMGMRKLAYEVQKHNRGYYTVYYFTAPTSTILEIERLLRINESILKFMTVKYAKKKEVIAWESAVKRLNNLTQESSKPAPEAPKAQEEAAPQEEPAS
jgi:small subunit ribosomal protein S6